MRDGRTVDERSMAEVPKLELVARMLGKELGEVRRTGQTGFAEAARQPGETLLEANDLRRGRALQGVNVEVREGEIVGLAGLLGSGRTETARASSGPTRSAAAPSASVASPPASAPRPTRSAPGIGFCTEDRKAEGIIPHLSVRENLTLAAMPLLARHGVVDRERQRAIVDRFMQRLGVRAAGPDQPIRELSGGNQQKVLLARWLCLNPRLLILDEPTRGIDVGAKAEIQSLIDELARDGLGVLMISSELEELSEGGDRVVVLRDGRTVAALDRAAATEDAIMAAMAHGDDGPAVELEPAAAPEAGAR
jgi:ribose transport system ATP-binding protein